MNFLWLDLETTGLDPCLDDILEVGIVITGPDLVSLHAQEWLVDRLWHDWRTNAAPAVIAMHTQSGLADALDLVASTPRLLDVESDIIKRIDPYLEDGKITLAGSGVGTFDLQFIKEQMPELASRLNYWVLDIGVVRRFLRDVVGFEPLEIGPIGHRALADVEHHLTEARQFVYELRLHRILATT